MNFKNETQFDETIKNNKNYKTNNAPLDFIE